MTTILLWTLGALHGLLGLVICRTLLSPRFRLVIPKLGARRATLRIFGSTVGASLLFACAFSSWFYPQFAVGFALGSLVVFVVATSANSVLSRGLFAGVSDLFPSFYVVVFIRIMAAFALWLLASNSPSQIVSG